MLWSSEVERIAVDASRPAGERQRARLLLAQHDGARADELVDDIATASRPHLTLIVQRLAPWMARILPEMWSRLTAPGVPPDARVRLAATVARLDPTNPRWSGVGPDLAASLLEEADPLLLTAWIEDLHPVRDRSA